MREFIGDQGEVTIIKIEELPKIEMIEHDERTTEGLPIISHSESGNNHVMERPVKVMKPKKQIAQAMDAFYLIVDEANALIQENANDAHERHDLPSGIYEMRIKRVFDTFMQQARQVAD